MVVVVVGQAVRGGWRNWRKSWLPLFSFKKNLKKERNLDENINLEFNNYMHR